MAEFVLDHDALYPRDASCRYRVYARRGDELRVLAAAPSPAGLGLALVQLDDDARAVGLRLADEGAIGVMDVLGGAPGSPRGRWLLYPWLRGDE